VIWCTGFREEFSWIDLPIFDREGRPVHERGVVVEEPGLYFVGLRFQYAVSSDVLPGVERDAEYIAKRIVASEPNSQAPGQERAKKNRNDARAIHP
jgi:putative flavoprotein involved in K+ transport